MGFLLQKTQKRPDWSPGLSAFAAACGACAAFLCWGEGAADAADLSRALPTKAPPAAVTSAADDWTGFYVGAHAGYAGGSSHWSTSGVSADFGLYQGFDAFKDTGSYSEGFQAGYNSMLPNRIVIGGELEASFPSFSNKAGISIGGSSPLSSPFGLETFQETVLASGTVRGRIGYAPADWLFYATGGFAWTYDRLTLTQLANGVTDMPFLWRFGWAAGVGVEAAIAPHWTARLEYLFTEYGTAAVTFPSTGQRFNSDFLVSELRVGLNYRFGDGGSKTPNGSTFAALQDNFAVHGQATFLEQYAPPFHSPYVGQNSLIQNQGRETLDFTAFLGWRLWDGAELWINPEIDQGFGLSTTLGVAGFTSGEAYKIGASYPYARLPRTFIRQTINLGGDSEKVDGTANQFEGSRTSNRLVLTIGKIAVTDIFDTNKYAHDPRTNFMNWALVDTGTFDYAADAWGYTYGAAVEWYQGQWTLRGGWFDLSVVPNSTDLDAGFGQFQWLAEVERRYDLWGHPGKIAVTGFLSRGRMGSFQDAINLAQITGGPANIAAVRKYQSRAGISMNVEQEITSDLGAFMRAGWADGNIEPYEFSDIDRTVSAGLSLKGKQWGRPDDTFGLAGIVNEISGVHQQFLNDGGLGILVGDGMLPHPGPEQIIETYYAFPLFASTVTLDYQFIVNPAYNRDRGPVSVIGARVHAEF
ncbi:MAG: carbohydrate porin [Xanthobacteraceae bacterium]|jgi:high affinity Mn2+ porin